MTAEEVREKRRAERKQFKMDRAAAIAKAAAEAEAAFAERPGSDAGTQRGSGDSSLIGSRYFARASTAGSGTESGGVSLANTIRARPEQRSETAVKITIAEGVFSEFSVFS